jgi:hypothetical protein
MGLAHAGMHQAQISKTSRGDARVDLGQPARIVCRINPSSDQIRSFEIARLISQNRHARLSAVTHSAIGHGRPVPMKVFRELDAIRGAIHRRWRRITVRTPWDSRDCVDRRTHVQHRRFATDFVHKVEAIISGETRNGARDHRLDHHRRHRRLARR